MSWKALLRPPACATHRLHDARHTAATLLLEQGVDIRVVQEILGHSTLAVTKRYTHVTDTLARHAAERMGRALWITDHDCLCARIQARPGECAEPSCTPKWNPARDLLATADPRIRVPTRSPP